ncbi:hypothetical protein HPB51_007102 [Rhipicephalus microplus]|uniref:Uncharacterized protein n=1 Tax=Rhipicephalus microplus TaxID=6941 RepID=A0A9J6E0L8_RHIMP|nr:hypothetical protein HPB51_007102 [Rhipicephalus microplus]
MTYAKTKEFPLSLRAKACALRHVERMHMTRGGKALVNRLLSLPNTGMSRSALEYGSLITAAPVARLLPIPPTWESWLSISTRIPRIRSKGHTPGVALLQETCALIEERIRTDASQKASTCSYGGATSTTTPLPAREMELHAISSTPPSAARTSSIMTVEDMDLATPPTSQGQGHNLTTRHTGTFERTTTEDDWHTILTLRQKKQQARERKQGEMAAAVTAVCQQTVTGEHFLLRIKPASNIVIISTLEQEVTERLHRITALTINGRAHSINVYAATGEEARRGVIHGIPSRTPSETLMANLRVRTQGVKIIQANAMITFCGPTLPRFVYCCGGELACQPYRATVQMCRNCCSKGHPTDVCPQPDAHVCRICETRDPTNGHVCVPKCVSCRGEHRGEHSSCSPLQSHTISSVCKKQGH